MNKLTPIKNVASFKNGFAFKSNKYTSEGIRIIRISNVQDGKIIDKNPKFYPENSTKEYSEYLLKDGDLLMSLTGDVGRVGFIKNELLPAYLNQRVVKIECDERVILKKYMYYFFKSPEIYQKIITMSKGVAQLNVSASDIFNLQIPVPSLQEQEKIVERLDKVFENIDTKINQKITLNNQYKKYINSYIEKELFQEKNPVKLKDLINVKRKNINNYSNKFIGLENIVSNTSEVVNVESMAVKSNTYKFDKGSLLYGRLRPYLNKVTIVDFDGHCSTEIFPIDTTKELNIKYLKYFLMTQKTVNKINLQTTGARMPRASVSVLENLKIDLKSQKEQSINVEIFDNLTTLVQNIVKVNLKIIENCKLLKKSILNKEFSYE
tara:strand:+ start:675 stop:1811 length:1137 start_codon:yes stop_codon:yes gene_type:complete